MEYYKVKNKINFKNKFDKYILKLHFFLKLKILQTFNINLIFHFLVFNKKLIFLKILFNYIFFFYFLISNKVITAAIADFK